MANQDIIDALEPVLTLCRNLDFDDPDEAEAWLEEAFPFASPDIQAVLAMCRAGVEQGWLCNRGEGAVRYSRVTKPTGPEQTFAVDAVILQGVGPAHRHPQGEVDLCFALDGDPTFDDRPPGWVVFGRDSEHAPTVAGGTMLILYMLPDGAIEWSKG